MKKRIVIILVLLLLAGCTNSKKTFKEEIKNEEILFVNIFLLHDNVGKKVYESEYNEYMKFFNTIDADLINKDDYEQLIGQYYSFEIILKSGKIIIYSGDDYIYINDNIYKIRNIDSVREKTDGIVAAKFGI